jgi:hypothetical protein
MKSYPGSEEIRSEACHYYNANSKYSNDFILGFTLTEPVDVGVLARAVELSIPRYPYMAVRLKQDGERYALVPNAAPVPVFTELPSVWGPESNDYLWCVLADGRDIDFHCFHGLADGSGMMPMARTVVCRYLMLKHPDTLAQDTINAFMKGEECSEEEWLDPYHNVPYADTEPYIMFQADSVYHPAGGRSDGEGYSKIIAVDEKEFIDYTTSVGGTPNLVASLFMGRAMDELRLSGESGMMVAGVSAMVKKFLGYPDNHHDAVSLLSLEFPEDLCDMDDRAVIADLRLKRNEAFKDSRMAGYANSMMMFADLINSQATLAEKRAIASMSVENNIGAISFSVSYMRSEDLGPLSTFIERMQNAVDIRGMPWMMEIVAGCGKITFNSLMSSNDGRLFEGFCRQLDSAGIAYETISEGCQRYVGWGY